MREYGTMVHKDTKQVLRHVRRLGRHFTYGRQTPIRYVGIDADGNSIELSPVEFRAYVPAVEAGITWHAAGLKKTVVSVEQVTKLQVNETVKAIYVGGPNRGKVAYVETNKVRGIAI